MASFFEVFVGISALNSLDNIESELDNQSYQLQEIIEQNQAQFEYEEQQRAFKDYIFQLSKSYREVEQYKKSDPAIFYVSSYFLLKNLHFSGINESYFDEIQDKEYFLNFRRLILQSIQTFDSTNINLEELNELIQKMENRNLLSVIYNSQRALVEIEELKAKRNKLGLFDGSTKKHIDSNIAEWKKVSVFEASIREAIADFMPEYFKERTTEERIVFVNKIKTDIEEYDSLFSKYFDAKTFLYILEELGGEETDAITAEFPIPFDEKHEVEEVEMWTCPRCFSINSTATCSKCGYVN